MTNFIIYISPEHLNRLLEMLMAS